MVEAVRIDTYPDEMEPEQIDGGGADGGWIGSESGRRAGNDDGEGPAGKLPGFVWRETRRCRRKDAPEDGLPLAEEPGQLGLAQRASDLAREVDGKQVRGQHLDHEIDAHSELDERVDVGIDMGRVPVEPVGVDEERCERRLGREVVVERRGAQVAGMGQRLNRRAAIPMGAEDRCGQAEELMTATLDTVLERRVEREPGHDAAIAVVGAGSGEAPSIGPSVRPAQARPRQ
jgi:hypothetical protein